MVNMRTPRSHSPPRLRAQSAQERQERDFNQSRSLPSHGRSYDEVNHSRGLPSPSGLSPLVAVNEGEQHGDDTALGQGAGEEVRTLQQRHTAVHKRGQLRAG